jgi:collagen type VI alpha
VLVPCQQARVDIVFIVDSSRSICNSDSSCSNWQSVLNFINSIIGSFTIGSNNIRVGLITFSSSAQNVFYLTSYTDASTLTAAVNRVSYTTLGSSSQNITAGLNLARTQLFTTANGDRLGAPSVAILLLNGASSTNTAAVRLSIDKEGS